ncbi:MAG: hypothetical protein E5V62_25875 [Mesorhizobium sp.]|uniref:hypothetical protein n=1 Tax=Mesorhizobium sp. TaxID=1871066 RepID=UPI000FD55006|nr:hypothetical protein [Mesorhizobium sp.]RVD71382.1 hypothetical protein EN751_15705 [Mesorhizobium sp. M4A.F.Ca.ET.029.04.2.1]TIW32236.1 MAG: hypothetical protein E5V62_25875 [Mesorhizobium sp.]
MTHGTGLTVTFSSPESGEAAAMSAAYMQKVIGENAVIRNAPGLAGPNDMVQILMHAAPWLAIYALGRPFLESMLKEAGKDTWEAIKSRFKKPAPAAAKEDDVMYLRVVLETLAKAREEGNYVVLGFPIEETSFKSRSIGIELEVVTPESLIMAAAILANIGDELESSLKEYDRKTSEIENRDCSCAIIVRGDGTTECAFRSETAPGQIVELRFDISGKRI